MAFNFDDYNENIDYCRYVFNKNAELNLGLENQTDIQVVANMYVDELLELQDGHIGEELVENDLLLFNVIRDYITKIRKNTIGPESIDYISKGDDELMFYSQNERLRNIHGGHGLDETYDDFGLDELDNEDQMKL